MSQSGGIADSAQVLRTSFSGANWRNEKHLRDCEIILPPCLIDSDNPVFGE